MRHDRRVRRLRTLILALTTAAGLGSAVPAQSEPAPVPAPAGNSTLTVGQSLQALSLHSTLTSPSGAFTLGVVPLMAEVDQWIKAGDVPAVGSPTWSTPVLSTDG